LLDSKTIGIITAITISITITLSSGLFFISRNNVLAENAPTSNNQNPNYNYNIKPGSWVRYVINGPYVHSDNRLLELVAKGMLSSAWIGTASHFSTNDIEWLQRNITRISGDNVTIQSEIKPYGKQPIIFKPVNFSLSNPILFPILPKNVKVGERIPTNDNSTLFVNRTVQKNIGGHNVAVYELTGQQNSFNTTSNLATQLTPTSYIDKVTGVPLQISIDFEAGSPLFGTVTGSTGLSAIDWSGRANSSSNSTNNAVNTNSSSNSTNNAVNTNSSSNSTNNAVNTNSSSNFTNNAVNTNSSSNFTDSTNAFSVFENKDFHFKMSYPTNWTYQTTGLVAHKFMHLEAPDPQAKVDVWVHNGRKSTLADYAKGGGNSTLDATGPGKIITTGSGLKAFQQTYYDYSQNSNVKEMDTVFIDGKDGIEYLLTYRTEPVDFDANLPIVKKMIDSFQVTDNASAS
jgi:hypothetical protein